MGIIPKKQWGISPFFYGKIPIYLTKKTYKFVAIIHYLLIRYMLWYSLKY